MRNKFEYTQLDLKSTGGWSTYEAVWHHFHRLVDYFTTFSTYSRRAIDRIAEIGGLAGSEDVRDVSLHSIRAIEH